ncbi:unnamed protein product [Gadus morhua 'NCC']
MMLLLSGLAPRLARACPGLSITGNCNCMDERSKAHATAGAREARPRGPRIDQLRMDADYMNSDTPLPLHPS